MTSWCLCARSFLGGTVPWEVRSSLSYTLTPSILVRPHPEQDPSILVTPR